MVDPKATKSARELLATREKTRARKRWVLYACIAGSLLLVLSIPFFIEAGWSRGELNLLMYGIIIGFCAFLAWRHKYLRDRCHACGRTWVMRRVGKKKFGYVQLECRHCGARKRGTIPEEEAGVR